MKATPWESGIGPGRKPGISVLTAWVTGVVGILLVGATSLAAEAGAGSATALAAGTLSNAPADSVTNQVTESPADKSLRFNFRNTPLETVLNYMSRAAGYVIHPEVSLNGRVDAWSDQPLSNDEALALLEHVLSDNGYAVVRDGRELTIYSANDSMHRAVPVVKFTRLEDIPRNAEVATYIIPVHTLNPVALVNNLRPLINPSSDVQANESANALLVTDSQSNIRRLANIVMQLDSVSSSINSIEVMPVKFADAKALADLVKQLFPSQDTGSANGAPSIAGFFGAGFGGPGAGGGSGSGSGSTPGTRVTATSDDHSNSLIVSAPEEMLPMIRELVRKLDQPVEDVIEVRVFHLANSDPTEMATLLGNLFPDPSSSSDASQSPFQIGGFGAFGNATPAAGSSTGPSQHMKKLASITTVPDPRTRSLLVSASKDMMPQVEEMISQLDVIGGNKLNVHTIALNNAEAADIMQIVQDIYPAGSTTTRQNTIQNNALMQRAQTLEQNALSSGPGSGQSTSQSGSSGTVATGF